MSWSNNPNPNQGGSYDQNLLFGAPQAPAQLWEGYDVGLLEGGRCSQHVQGPASPATSAPPAVPPPPVHQGPQVFAVAEKGTEEQFVAYASKPRTGFWHNRKGTIIVVFLVVVIAAVVGGVVGGTLGDPGIHSTSQSSPPSGTTSDNLTSTMNMADHGCGHRCFQPGGFDYSQPSTHLV